MLAQNNYDLFTVDIRAANNVGNAFILAVIIYKWFFDSGRMYIYNIVGVKEYTDLLFCFSFNRC